MGDHFYIGWAHQYIRTKGKFIDGPGQYKIGQGDQLFIGRLRPTLPQGVVMDTTPLAVKQVGCLLWTWKMTPKS
jgi:hypothetical protein